jgi:hypothetical protein
VIGADDSFPDDVITLKAVLRAERTARLAAEAEAQAQTLLSEAKLQSTEEMGIASLHPSYTTHHPIGLPAVCRSAGSDVAPACRSIPINGRYGSTPNAVSPPNLDGSL